MNESYHISSFGSLREFTDKLPFLWHLLNCKLPKRGRKLLAWSPYFNTWTLVLQGKICVSVRVGKLFTKCLLSEFSVRSLSKKWYLRLYLTHQTVKCSLLDEKFVYQSFYGVLSCLVFFYFKEILSFARVGKSLARCLLSKAFRRPCRKNYISGYIRHKLFIQTVKCFFFK